MTHTVHFTRRTNQRGLPPAVVDIILEHGVCSHAPGGAVRVFFGKKQQRELVQSCKKAIQLTGKARGGCIILAGEALITAYKSGRKQQVRQ